MRQLAELGTLMDDARKNGKNIFVLGNGGSAAAASHWVCDFGKGINSADSKRMKIMSLADNTGIFSAYGNDLSYDETLSEQLKNFLEAGDLVISLSVSGNSPNLLAAHAYARQAGTATVAIIGDYDGRLSACSDLTILIPSKNYGVAEDIHLIICHMISQYLAAQNRLLEKGM